MKLPSVPPPKPEPEAEPLPVLELPPVPPPKIEPEREPVAKDVPGIVLKQTPAPGPVREPTPEVASTVPAPPPLQLPKERVERQPSPPSRKQGEIREFFRTRLLKLRGMFANFGRVIGRAREYTSRPASAAAPELDQSPRRPREKSIFFKTPELNLNAAFETKLADVPCDAKASLKEPSEIGVDIMEARSSHHKLERRSHSRELGENRLLAPARLNIVADFKPLPAGRAPPDIRGTVHTAPPTNLEPAVLPATARIVLPSSPSASSKTTMLLAAQFAPPLNGSKDRIAAQTGVIARPAGSRIGSRRHLNTARPKKSRRQTRAQISAVFEPISGVRRFRDAEAPQAAACGSGARVREPFYPPVA
ncbi:hypothetical protein MTO96_041513 [Rhipicephalus appendiculatus]